MSKTKIFAVIYALAGLFIILTPTYIAPVCSSPLMHCRTTTLPLIVLLGAIVTITAIAEFIINR